MNKPGTTLRFYEIQYTWYGIDFGWITHSYMVRDLEQTTHNF